MKQHLKLHFQSKTKTLLLLLCTVPLALISYAQGIDSLLFPKTEMHALHAKTNGQEYRLFVSLPESYNANDTVRYPVLYLLDGNLFFPQMQAMQRLLVSSEEMPELIIVGVGYPTKNVLESIPFRTIDYTPTRDTAFDKMLTKELHTTVASGGAMGFLRTLKQELLPFIEQRYKTSGDRGFAGHSFGALFGAYVLFHEPQLFGKYLLSSVSMPWDGAEMLQEEQAYFKAGNKTLQADVYISVGEQEENGMQPLMKQLTAAMRARNYKGLQVREYVLTNESHASAVTTALNQGLRALYKNPVKKG